MLDPVWLLAVDLDVGGSGLLEVVIGLEGLAGMVDLPRLLAVLDLDLGRSAVVTNLDGSKVVVVVDGLAWIICVLELADLSALVVGVRRFSEEVDPEGLAVGGLMVLVDTGEVEVVVNEEQFSELELIIVGMVSLGRLLVVVAVVVVVCMAVVVLYVEEVIMVLDPNDLVGMVCLGASVVMADVSRVVAVDVVGLIMVVDSEQIAVVLGVGLVRVEELALIIGASGWVSVDLHPGSFAILVGVHPDRLEVVVVLGDFAVVLDVGEFEEVEVRFEGLEVGVEMEGVTVVIPDWGGLTIVEAVAGLRVLVDLDPIREDVSFMVGFIRVIK